MGKLPFAFPDAVNSVVHSGMGSYAHCPQCFFAFKAFLGQDITGQGYCPGLAVPVCFFAALCALNTGSGSPVSGSAISALCHSFCKWRSVPSSVWSVPDILLSA